MFAMVFWRQDMEERCLLLEIGSRYLQHEKNCFMLSRIIITVAIWLLDIRCMRRMLGRGAAASSVVRRDRAEERSLVPVETRPRHRQWPTSEHLDTNREQRETEGLGEHADNFPQNPHLLTESEMSRIFGIRIENFPLLAQIINIRNQIWTPLCISN